MTDKRIAFLVGVGQYEHLPRLRTARNNAAAIRDMLMNEALGHFDAANVEYLEDASSLTIQKKLAALLRNAGDDDEVLIYLSGHGLRSDDIQGRYFFAGTDADKDEPEVSALANTTLFDRIRSSAAKKFLIIVDACYSGGFGKPPEDLHAGLKKIEMIASTGSAEYSFESLDPDVAHSRFTELLIEATRDGRGGNCANEFITAKDIVLYLERSHTIRDVKYKNASTAGNEANTFVVCKHPHFNRVPPWIHHQLTSKADDQVKEVVQYLRYSLYITSDKTLTTEIHAALLPLLQHRNADIVRETRALLRGDATAFSSLNPAGGPQNMAYLDWLIQEHSFLRLQGIHSATRHRGVRLENVYVALRGEKSSSYEKQKTKDLNRDFLIAQIGEKQYTLLTEEKEYEIYIDLLQNDPVMPALAERDKLPPEYDIPVTVGEAFREERFLIILGDPGSGKTTIAKWFALQLAKSYKDHLTNGDPVFVELPEHQIDPYFDVTEITYNLGPVRHPILISISDYAQYYTECADNPNATRPKLIDYIGRHRWQGKPPAYPDGTLIPETELRQVFKTYLQKGEAVVILDGMDEVTKYRKNVVSEIESFIDTWVIGKGKEFLNDLPNWNNFNLKPPGESGGNQVVITSRIIGYHLSPILRGITHVTIEPMKKKAIARFCDMWLHELTKIEFGSGEDNAFIAQLARSESGKLKEAIFNDQQILELASNPLLITIIALVFRNNEGRLPPHRASLYKEALITLIKTWKQPGLSLNEVEYVLSAVASTIHINYPKGIIRQEELRSIIKNNLEEYRRINLGGANLKFRDDFQDEVDTLLKEIENKIGIIAPRGHKSFGFIHLTFQEYLASLYIIRDPANAFENIQQYLEDPRWKVPLLMALGHISVEEDWDSSSVNNLLSAILHHDSNLNRYFPRNALMLAQAFAEISLEKVSESIIEKVILKLLEFYADKKKEDRYPDILKRIEKSFHLIKRSQKGSFLESWIVRLISAPTKNEERLVPAVVSIISGNRWFSKKIIQSLFFATRYDSREWDWIIYNTLMKLVSNELRIVDKPVEPKPPETPKAKFEKKVQDYHRDLLDLVSGELKARIEKRVRELELQLSIDALKVELTDLNWIVNKHRKIQDQQLQVMERILNHTLEKSLQDALTWFNGTWGKDERLFKRLESEYSELAGFTTPGKAIRHLLNELNSGDLAEHLNNRIKIISRMLKSDEKQFREKNKALKTSISNREYLDFQRNLEGLQESIEVWDQTGDEQVGDTLEIVKFLLNLKTPPLKSLTSTYHDQAAQHKSEYLEGKARLERIENGEERANLIEKIRKIREEINSEQFPLSDYRAELVKYNFSFKYYEDALQKYQDQEIATVHIGEWVDMEIANSFPMENLKDILIYTLFFGGYWYSSQLEVSREFDKTAWFLRQDDATRELMIEQNPYFYHGKFGTDDVVYNAAVTLDVRTIRLDDFRIVRKMTESPEFDAFAIYRMPALNFRALSDLAARIGNDGQWKGKIGEEGPIIDATIFKIFHQKNVRDAISIIDGSPYKKKIIDRLNAIRSTLAEPVFLSEKMVISKLVEAARSFDPEDWFPFYSRLLKSLQKASGRAVPVEPIFDAAPALYKGVALADYWYSASILEQFDLENTYASIIEIFRDEVYADDVANALLQVPYAQTYQNRRYIADSTDWLVADYVDSSIYADDPLSLDLLQAIENYRLVHARGWTIGERFRKAHLYQLIQAFRDSSRLQKEELVLFCLQNNLYDEGLEEFLPVNVRSLSYLENELFRDIRKIADEFYKSRALIRFLPFAKDKKGVMDELNASCDRISDPFKKAQIVLSLQQKNIKRYGNSAAAEFSALLFELDEPLKFIKTFFEGYPLVGQQEIGRANDMFMKLAAQIDDVHLRSRLWHQALAKRINPELTELIKAHLTGNAGEDELAIGLGLFGLRFALHDGTLSENEQGLGQWTPILLYSALDDLIDYYEPSENVKSESDLWKELMDKPSEEKIKELIQLGIEDGLELSLPAANVLDQLIGAGPADIYHPLLALLKKANAGSMTIVEKWLTAADDQLKRYACVYHAEYHQRISEKNIDGILELRHDADSRTYNRVGILLSNGITNVKRVLPRIYTSSELGLALIDKIIDASNADVQQRGSLISYMLEDILADSAGIVDRFLAKSDAQRKLEWPIELSEPVEAYLARCLEDKTKVTPFFLESVIDLLIRNSVEHKTNKQRLYSALGNALTTHYAAELAKYRFLPNNVFDLLEVVTWQKTLNIEEARRAVNERMLGIDETWCNTENEDLVENGLAPAAGYHYNINYIFRYQADIQRIRDIYSDERYEFFIDWLLASPKMHNSERLDLHDIQPYLLIILSIWTGEHNTSILNAKNNNGDLYKMLTGSLTKFKIVGRFSAINILAHINQHTKQGLTKLLVYINSVPHIQKAVVHTLSHIKNVDEEILDFLLADIFNVDPLSSSVYISILSNYAKDFNIKPAIRQKIISALSDCLRDERSHRGVYCLAGAGNIESRLRTEYIGRLDDIIFKSIVEITDI